VISRRFGTTALATLVLCVSVCTAACTPTKKTPPEQVAAAAYLNALGGRNADAAAKVTDDASAAATAIKASLDSLGSTASGQLQVSGLADRTKTSATANYTASWKLPGTSSSWTYTGTLPMIKQANSWLVKWSPAAIYPRLPAASHLALKRVQPPRSSLTDRAGAPLFTPTKVVTVGIDPAKVTNLNSLAAALAAVPQLQSTAAEIISAVKAAPKTQLVPIITLRQQVYATVRDKIYNLDGTQFQSGTELLPPTSQFAKPLLGNVGQATKEIIDSSSGRIVAGDTTGLSGLQRALDAQLAGSAGVDVYAAADSDGALGTKLATVSAPKPGTPVQLTLDRTIQNAADAALSTVALPAALVAVQPSTGKILAVANSAAASGDIALVGQYPAGSTFKIVTYTAAFANKPTLTASSPVECPATVTVNGRQFENENKFSHGTIPLSAAFAYSCNTTAIATAMGLPATALHQAATSLGLGAQWDLGGIDAFSGSIPQSVDGTERAAEAIGQGKVLVSPLSMASIAGSAMSGKPIAPSLLASKPGAAGSPQPARLTAALNALMRATVSQPGATAYALSDLPGNVEGKTGTAEFGNANPPKSHSWFAGGRGDLAFAVFIYGGEASTSGAVPIARSFLTAVP
jgi:cell division protein FtsI/penicillin-binding protein 2